MSGSVVSSSTPAPWRVGAQPGPVLRSRAPTQSMAHGPAPAPTITWWALIPRPCGRSPRTGPRPAGRGRAPSLPGGPRPSAPQRLGVAAGGLVSLLPAEHPGQLVDQLGAVEADDRRRHRLARRLLDPEVGVGD